MVEALASGKAVLALGRGGAVEPLRDCCGVLYDEPNELCLAEALKVFDSNEDCFPPASLHARAAEYSEEVFDRKFREIVHRQPSELNRQSPVTDVRLIQPRPKIVPIGTGFVRSPSDN